MGESRRRFLVRTAGACGAAAAASALPGCAPRLDAAPLATVAAAVDGKLSVPVGRYPALASDGGALAVTAPGLDEPVLLIRQSATQYVALGSICTHAGCPLGVEGGAPVCPCHGSRFGADGKVENPPAVQGLPTWTAKFDPASGDVVIDLAGGDANFPALVGGKVSFDLAVFTQLGQPGGSVSGTPSGWGKPLLVIALAGGGYAALDATCTHLRCLVSYAPGNKDVECPCHGSAFSTAGAVLAGPAAAPLTAYPASLQGTAVVVVLSP